MFKKRKTEYFLPMVRNYNKTFIIFIELLIIAVIDFHKR